LHAVFALDAHAVVHLEGNLLLGFLFRQEATGASGDDNGGARMVQARLDCGFSGLEVPRVYDLDVFNSH
jgi:hypothetical protein